MILGLADYLLGQDKTEVVMLQIGDKVVIVRNYADERVKRSKRNTDKYRQANIIQINKYFIVVNYGHYKGTISLKDLRLGTYKIYKDDKLVKFNNFLDKELIDNMLKLGMTKEDLIKVVKKCTCRNDAVVAISQKFSLSKKQAGNLFDNKGMRNHLRTESEVVEESPFEVCELSETQPEISQESLQSKDATEKYLNTEGIDELTKTIVDKIENPGIKPDGLEIKIKDQKYTIPYADKVNQSRKSNLRPTAFVSGVTGLNYRISSKGVAIDDYVSILSEDLTRDFLIMLKQDIEELLQLTEGGC